MGNISQDNPKHWRYKKNKASGNLEAMKQSKVEADMKNIIKYNFEEGDLVSARAVDADHDSLKELNREHQLVICKSFKLKGFTDLNEAGLIKLILKTHKKKVKGTTKGVTTMETLKKNKKRNLETKEKKEKKEEKSNEEKK